MTAGRQSAGRTCSPLPQIKQGSSRPRVFLNDSEAAQYVWLGFSLALSYLVGGRKKKEIDQISVPLNCPGFVQPTVIVRLPPSSRGPARGSGSASSSEQAAAPLSGGEGQPTHQKSPFYLSNLWFNSWGGLKEETSQ